MMLPNLISITNLEKETAHPVRSEWLVKLSLLALICSISSSLGKGVSLWDELTEGVLTSQIRSNLNRQLASTNLLSNHFLFSVSL